MDHTVAESTMQALIPGKCVDLYYPDPETAEKQCFRTSLNTKYTQQFANLTGGTSVFTISPANGIQDIVLTFQMSNLSGANTGLALPTAWAYALIKQVSYRVGGSSQYFITGSQMLQAALKNAPDGASRQALYNLGGQQLTGANFDTAGAFNYGYAWLNLPWTKPASVSKMPPLPTDLLTQQVQITVELFPIASIFTTTVGGSPAPTGLLSAQFQVQQIAFENRGDALANRIDMTTHSLSYPCEFVQQELAIPVANTAGVQQVSLTGFRSGEVKSIQCWLTVNGDMAGSSLVTRNPLNWYQPNDIVMNYMGDQYAVFPAQSSLLWNLVNGRVIPTVSCPLIAPGGAPGANGAAWAELPFGQSFDTLTDHTMYVSGKEILNGIVQLQFNLGADILSNINLSTGVTLHVSYIYNSVLVFSSGTADFAF